jgi:hypothetical protein
MRQRWKSGCVGIVAGCMLVIMVLALGGVAIQRQLIVPPEAHICLRSTCLVAHTVRIAACPPLIPCQTVPGLVPTQDRYIVVLTDDSGQPGSQGRNTRVLFTLPLKR